MNDLYRLHMKKQFFLRIRRMHPSHHFQLLQNQMYEQFGQFQDLLFQLIRKQFLNVKD